ncbi:TetR family transcriptional regulator [Kitasatospora sp. SolWspMP-SS2h]|uniref:TetR/AcrR family transcriptional regulator n=1 Tax=Kitasatospora sp. SolWspMP-SS2h TaxID=1305729 RepID=UPI000DBAC14C|nr:TetR/AcrR family transcriptional regulator [Kitasatospora sp. SolWspMP-SS2h]RAJ44837.1 TetR family transcriptional regulator [Kitasatospora sp. SolWspMP-SS2h]
MDDSPAPAPRSRRERPAKPALTRAGIVAAAVRLMEAEGLQRVTMRRLAQELDTGPASLYVYVANTAELHAAILEHHLGRVDLGAAAGAGAADPGTAGDPGRDWRGRLAAVLESYTAVLLEHPALAHSALLARPAGPHYLALVETLLALLEEGGVPAGQAAWGVDTLLQVATATAAEHSARTGAAAEAEHGAMVRALREADPSRYPKVAATAGELVSGRPAERLAWTFRMLINGVAATPR